jgi:very-short-patch-repair endonuclease
MSLSLQRRRTLRRNATDAEAVLWYELRNRQIGGFKFRRRHPCGPYIVDFYCAERKLAIELDGGQHFTLAAQAYDARRSRYLRKHGIEILRFQTDLVFREGPELLEEIARALGIGCPSPRPSPRCRGEWE